MNPNQDIPEPKQPHETLGTGLNGANGSDPMSKLQPIPVPPEVLEWALQHFSREDLMAELREIEETGGVSSEEFLRAIEQAARDDG
jgi:hypothetical protein